MRPSVAAALAALLAPAVAQAQVAPPPAAPARLGEVRGPVIFTSDLALDLHRVTVDTPGAGSVTSTSYDFRLGFDRVVFPRLTVGLWLGLEGELQGLDQAKRFEIGGRVGGIVALGSSALWWPTLGFGYAATEVADRSSSASLRTWTVTASSPLLWHAGHHIMIGGGPTLSTDFKAKTGPTAEEQGPKTTSMGLHGLIGVWF